MKKYKISNSVLLTLSLLFACSLTVYANSSWHWISATRPYDVLPFVIVLTLVIEVLFLYFIAKVKTVPKLTFFVILANLVSFAAPYLLLYITPILDIVLTVYTFEETLERTPFYTIGIVYLLMTVIIEVPIVYFALRKSTTDKSKLLYTVLGANTLTTVLTAIIERVVCAGSW